LTEVIDPGGGTDPPTFIAPLHIHDRDDEAWYVLDGSLAFRVDESEAEVRRVAASRRGTHLLEPVSTAGSIPDRDYGHNSPPRAGAA
jgi:uncharacterized cupin superfamily protein